MAAPVWVLSVDLQTKTATFQTGLADAAKSARGSFQDIKAAATEMGDGVAEASGRTEYSMMGARHGVMMLGEEFNVHLPRGITAFIVSLGPVGAAMEAAFPFLAIILGATLLYEHLSKLHEAANKLTDSQASMGETIQSTFNKLDDKLLAVGIRADELGGNHLAALRKQLELIDHQELKNLIEEFGTLDKVSVAVLNQLKAHWYELGSGSTGAVHALDEFKGKYESLLAQGKSKEAGDLLAGTLASAEKVLALQKQAIDNQGHSGGQHGDYTKYEQASVALKQAGVGFTQKEVEAQQTLTDALRAQVTVAEKLHAIGGGEKKNDSAAEVQREEAAQNKLYETQQRGLEKRMQLEREYDKKRDEALNKGMDERVKEGELEAQATMAVNKSLLEAEKERLHIAEELGKEEAEHVKKMAELTLHAEQDAAKESVKIHKHRSDEVLAGQISAENAEYAAQMRGYQIELASLDKYGKDYEVKLKQIQDREEELTLAHENKVTQIKEKAQEEQQSRELAAMSKFDDALASGMMKVLSGHESMGKMLIGIGNEVASGMMENALKSIMALDMTKEKQAAAAARDGYLAGMKFPFPVNLVMAPMLGAMAFSSMMAFEEGGIVPGVERGDVVPARLTPGEGIIPKPLMDNLTHAAQSGDTGRGGDTHVHVHMTNHVNTIDGDGMQQTLEKHADVVEQHVYHALRKRNM
jgi:hypothetical protein